MTYFDSAYIAKCYVWDNDSASVRDLVQASDDLCSSAICKAEVAAALHRQFREGLLAQETVEHLIQVFREHCDEGRWKLFPVSERVLEAVQGEYRRLPQDVWLRSSAAIHLLTARLNGCLEIWSSDRRLLNAAHHFGLRPRCLTGGRIG